MTVYSMQGEAEKKYCKHGQKVHPLLRGAAFRSVDFDEVKFPLLPKKNNNIEKSSHEVGMADCARIRLGESPESYRHTRYIT